MNKLNNSTSNQVPFQIITLTITGIVLIAYTSFSLLALAGTLFTVYILIKLIFGFGEGIPINLVIVFLASLQWIIGPILSYYTGIVHPFYGMQVQEEEYLSFILPGVILYHIGLSLPLIGLKHIPRTIVQNLDKVTSNKIKGAYYLIALGFIASFAKTLVPGSIYFFFFLLGNLKFIGCFYLYTSNYQNKKVLYLVYSLLVLQALASALFHDLLLWTMFFLFIYCLKNPVSLQKKLSTLIFGFFLVFLLQSVKYQYRSFAWADASLSTYDKAGMFFSLVGERIMSPGMLFDAKPNELTITRLNQGWIITRVMNYVPMVMPFAEGETVKEAFSAALLPRFISQDKAVAGGRNKMERFTGIVLQEGTSMNISLIGEGYGNFGINGGILFMFFVGITFSFIFRIVLLKSIKNPTFIFWIPFLYLQVVKAETDLTTTLNYLVKSVIVMIIVYYVFRKILKIEI